VTRVSAGQRPFWWVRENLNQRPHPYQRSTGERCYPAFPQLALIQERHRAGVNCARPHQLGSCPLAGRCNRALTSGARPPGRAPSPGAVEPYPPGARPPERAYVNGHPPGTEAASAETSDRDRKTCQPSTPRTAAIPPAVALPSGRAASHRPEVTQTPSCLLRAAASSTISPLLAHLRPIGHVVASVLISLRCRTEWWEELSVQLARRAADASEKDRAVPGARTAGRRTARIWHVVEGQSLAVPGIRPGST
jgi:hypothetical protein